MLCYCMSIEEVFVFVFSYEEGEEYVKKRNYT